jgi:flagellar basal body-associated protein FliL
LFNSEALTKLQSIILVVVIVFALLGAVVVFIFLGEQEPSSEIIKIGVCADLDQPNGKAVWQGAVLAAEQVNDQGGGFRKESYDC